MIQLTITMDDAGKVSASGPIQDKVLCYGLLEAAKDGIRQWHVEQTDGPKIVAPNGADVLAIAGKRNNGA